jgi:hypothetical protein
MEVKGRGMKLFYMVLLMGAAAIGGGLLVRYSERPIDIAMAHSVPPTVVGPPIPPSAHVGPSSSVPVRSAPSDAPADAPAPPKPNPPAKPKPMEKPSAFSASVRVAEPDHHAPDPPRPLARVRLAPEPPAVVPLERSVVPARTPAVAPQSAPAIVAQATPPKTPVIEQPVRVAAPPPSPSPAVPEPNRATLRAGLLISVRINEALSSNLNSPGDVFSGTLDKPLIADGFVIAERGARVRGEVVNSRSDGRATELSIRLREVVASDGQRVHLVTDPWRRPGGDTRATSVYDTALTRGGAAVIRPATTVTFRLGDSVELTEKH